MEIINYEEDKYITLSFSDFCTTEVFDYEIAHSKGTINTVLKDNYTLSSKSKHINWIKCNFNYLKAIKNEDNLLTLVKNLCAEGRCRKKIHDNDFYIGKNRDNYIKDIKTFYNVFNKNKVNKKLQYYFSGTSCGWLKALPKVISFLKHYLNGWPDEKIELYYTYAYHKWHQSKKVYLHQSKKGELPYIFFDYKIIKTNKEVQKEKITKQAMDVNEFRNKLLKGYILCFVYNDLKVEIKPPLIRSNKSYDFSKSIFINDILLPTLDINSNEYKSWMLGADPTHFKEKVYELINANANATFLEDPDCTLTRHCYNIRATSDNEIHYYTVTYILDKEPTKIQIEVLTEYTKERAEEAVVHKTGCYPNEIKNIHEHGT